MRVKWITNITPACSLVINPHKVLQIHNCKPKTMWLANKSGSLQKKNTHVQFQPTRTHMPTVMMQKEEGDRPPIWMEQTGKYQCVRSGHADGRGKTE